MGDYGRIALGLEWSRAGHVEGGEVAVFIAQVAVIHTIRFKPPTYRCPLVTDAEGLCARGSEHIDSCVFAIDTSYERMSHPICIDVVSDDGARVQILQWESTLAGGRTCARRVKRGDLAAGNFLLAREELPPPTITTARARPAVKFFTNVAIILDLLELSSMIGMLPAAFKRDDYRNVGAVGQGQRLLNSTEFGGVIVALRFICPMGFLQRHLINSGG